MNKINVENTKPLEGTEYISSWLKVLLQWIFKQYLTIGRIIFPFLKQKSKNHFCKPKETSLVLYIF